MDAELSVDGSLLVIVLKDGVATVWDTKDGVLKHTFERHDEVRGQRRGHIRAVAFSPDMKWLATGGAPLRQEELAIWNLESGEIALRFLDDLRSFNVNGIMFSRDSRFVIAHSTNSVIHVFGTEDGREIAHWASRHGQLRDIVLHPDGEQIITSGYGGAVRIWKITTGELMQELLDSHRTEDKINALSTSVDGSRLLVAHESGRVNLWDLERSERVLAFDLHRSTVSEVELSPDAGNAVTLGQDLKIWSGVTGLLSQEINANMFIAMNDDGTRVLSGSYSDSSAVDIYSIPSGEKEATLYGHERSLIEADFMPHGMGVWSVARDGNAIIWKRKQ